MKPPFPPFRPRFPPRHVGVHGSPFVDGSRPMRPPFVDGPHQHRPSFVDGPHPPRPPPMHPGMVGHPQPMFRGGPPMPGSPPPRGFHMHRHPFPPRHSHSPGHFQPPPFRPPPPRMMMMMMPPARPEQPQRNDSKKEMELVFSKPWINDELKTEILRKHKMHQKARKTKKLEAWEAFREQRNKVTALLRDAKVVHEGGDASSQTPKKDCNFFCDTCDRAFETRDGLDEHYGQHEKCGIEGCQFEAHATIVERHVKWQHDAGYASQIMQLTSDDQIDKWKAERKKNFPTAGAVEKRQSEQAKKLDRGEVLAKAPPPIGAGRGKKKPRQRGRGNPRGMNHPGRGPSGFPPMHLPCHVRGPGPFQMGVRPHFAPPPQMPPPPHMMRGQPGMRVLRGGFRGRMGHRTSNILPSRGGLKKFGGTINSAMAVKDSKMASGRNAPSDNSSFDNDPQVNNFEVAHDPSPTSLAYFLGGDSENEGPEEIPAVVKRLRCSPTQPAAIPIGGALGCLISSYASESEAETLDASKESVNDCPKNWKTTRQQRSRTKPAPASAPTFIRKYQLTLLQKLLAEDIRYERNSIFQCIRYIVNNNFFHPARNDEDEPTTTQQTVIVRPDIP